MLLATLNLPKSLTFLRIFCKGVKIYHFWASFIDIWRFFSGHTVIVYQFGSSGSVVVKPLVA